MRKSIRTLMAIALIALLTFGSSFSAFATTVTPNYISGNDPTSGAYSGFTRIKFDPPNNGTKSDDGFSVTAVFSSDKKWVSFTSNAPVEYVFVKGGDGGNMYHYLNGSFGDTDRKSVV